MTEDDAQAQVERPVEVWVAMALNAGAALVFFGVALARQATEGGSGLLQMPIYLLLLGAAACAFAVWRPRNVRVLFGIAALLPVLPHVLFAMGNQTWWLRTISGILAAAYLYSLVLINTRPARLHLDGPVPPFRSRP